MKIILILLICFLLISCQKETCQDFKTVRNVGFTFDDTLIKLTDILDDNSIEVSVGDTKDIVSVDSIKEINNFKIRNAGIIRKQGFDDQAKWCIIGHNPFF